MLLTHVHTAANKHLQGTRNHYDKMAYFKSFVEVTTPSVDSGHQDNSSPPGFFQIMTQKFEFIFNILDNPVFLETEKLIARCIQRANEIELEPRVKNTKELIETELYIEDEVANATNMKVHIFTT